MTTSLTAFRTEFNELLVPFLWRQWSALGVAGPSEVEDDWAIDPEALVLITSLLGRLDARLFDEVLDWLHQNGKLISLIRLKNLYSNRKIGDPWVLAATAEVIGDKAALRKWQGVTDLVDEVVPQEDCPFFRSADGEPLPMFGKTDPVFEKFHYLRSPVGLRGMSRPPNPNLRPNLWLKLRALLGVNARSDAMLYLLTHREGHPGEMAKRLDYTPKTLQDTLNEMELSGHVRSWRDGREKKFALRPDDWDFLVTWRSETEREQFPRWIDWPAVFTALDRVHRMLMSPQRENETSFLQAAEFRSVMDQDTVGQALADAGVLQRSRVTDRLTGEDYVAALLADLREFLG